MSGTAHVIGNGASNHSVHIPVHFTVSCNIPTHSVPFDVTTIIDTRVVDVMLERKVHFTQTIWCTQVVRDYAHKKQVQVILLRCWKHSIEKVQDITQRISVLAWVMTKCICGAWTA